MSSTGLCKTPSVDYFSLVTQRPQNITASSPYRGFLDDIDSSHSPNDILSSATESDSTFLTTPTSPASSSFPHPTYHLPPTPSTEKTASARQARALTGTLTSALDNFGTVEDWMCWDDSLSDPCDKALSPTSEYFPELKLEPVSPVMSSINPRTISNGSDEPLFPTESLYSTPLSWSRPTPGPADRDIRRPQPQMFSALSPSEESKLRSIAMPAQTQYPASPSSASSPEQMDNRRKRKSSIDDDDEDMEEDSGRPMRSGGRQQPIKKTAHNMIEKRYRTNLNDKIAALRDSVPSLRVMVKKNSRGEDIEEDLQGLTPAHKLNKATVLAKATEYIAHLEKRNKHICKENAQLKARIEAFEILVMSQSQSPQQQQNQVQQQQQHRQQQQHQQSHNSAYRQNSTSNNAHMEWLG